MKLQIGQRWMYAIKDNGKQYLIEVDQIFTDGFVSCRFLWSSDVNYKVGTVGRFFAMPKEDIYSESNCCSYTYLSGQDRPQ